MMEEELNKPITKKDLKEVLGDFTDEILLPAVENLIESSANSVKKELREEIKKSEQAMMDYTDKRVGESEGKINLRLNKVEKGLDKVDLGLNKVEQRLDKVEQRLDEVDQRLDKVEQGLDRVDVGLNKVDQKLDTLVEVLEEKSVIKAEDIKRVKFATASKT